MRRTFAARMAAVVCLCAAVSGCTGATKPTNGFVGSWESDHHDGLVVSANGTLVIGTQGQKPLPATYVVKDATTMLVQGPLGVQDLMHLTNGGNTVTSTLSHNVMFHRVDHLDFDMPTP